MTLTGCRPGEIARVTAAEVDFEQGLWVQKKHKTAKKTGKPRIIYLPPEAVELTRELVAKRPVGPLFLNSRGKPWTRNAVRIRFRNLRKKFPELKGIVAYSYRSSYATDALEDGVPDATVAALLGHTGTATLHRFYNRLAGRVGHLKDAAATASRSRAAGGPPAATT
jgi:integrase